MKTQFSRLMRFGFLFLLIPQISASAATPQQALEAYLKSGKTDAYDSFGVSVAISGDTAVVGKNNDGSGTTGVNSTPDASAPYSGAVYIFVRSGTTWTQQAYLKPAVVGTSQVQDSFGSAVAISGDTVVVGAPGEDSSTTGVNSTPDEGSKYSGAAYVFVRSGTTWMQQAYLKPAAVGTTQAKDYFGTAVAVSGDTVVVGAYAEDGNSPGVNGTPNESAADAGAAYVFVRNGTDWTQQAYLKASNPGAGDNFGVSVAVSGDRAVIGATQESSGSTGVNSTPDETAAGAGAAYVFVRDGTTWTQEAYLKPAAVGTTQAGDAFGVSVAISGETVAVGASKEGSSTTGVNSTPNEGAGFAGAAYIFVHSVDGWSQQAYVKPAAIGTTQAGDFFGRSVAISGDNLLVGAPGEGSSSTGVDSVPNENAAGAGAAYLFTRSGTTWSQQDYLKPSKVGTTQAGDGFGLAVNISEDTEIIGAYQEDSSTTGVNSTPNESSADSGAAFIFAPAVPGPGPTPTPTPPPAAPAIDVGKKGNANEHFTATGGSFLLTGTSVNVNQIRWNFLKGSTTKVSVSGTKWSVKISPLKTGVNTIQISGWNTTSNKGSKPITVLISRK